jgi:hypothetical protein
MIIGCRVRAGLAKMLTDGESDSPFRPHIIYVWSCVPNVKIFIPSPQFLYTPNA